MALRKERGSNKTKGLCKLAIDEDMTIYVIDMLKQELTEQIETYENFELNLADVEEFDSAGVQLMLAFKQELKSKNKTFQLTAASPSVTNLITRYGLSESFNLGEGE
jgi:anti-sigma B factor antagonist